MVAWLNLDQWLPYTDARRIVYSYLDAHDRRMVELAHGVRNVATEDMYGAIKLGHLEQVQYLYGGYMWVIIGLVEFALYHEQDAIALWLCSQNGQGAGLLRLVIRMRKPDMVRYLIVNLQWTWYTNAISDIVCEGDLELAQWAINHGCEWERQHVYLCRLAVRFNEPHRFQWVQTLGKPMDALSMSLARRKWPNAGI